MPPRSLTTITVTVLASLAGAGCGSGGTTAPGPSQTMRITAGNNQTASLGGSLAIPPAVTISDQAGAAVSGVAVTFAVTDGGGYLTLSNGTAPSATITTGSDGVATSPRWTLGTTAGANTMTATAAGVTGSPQMITATGAVGAPAQIVIFSGNNLSGTAGVALDVVQFVKVLDGAGQPVPNASVTYLVTGGGGSLEDDPTHLTGPTGLTFVRGWVLGTAPGINTMTATITGTALSVTFTATGH